MLRYAIGLDLGITSVGWATVLLDEDENPIGIIDMNARIFDAAEHPKNGASLAAPRREARSTRRRLRRHRHRNERIRSLLLNEKLLTKEELDHLFDGRLSDIYELRVAALDRPVSKAEFVRILLHLSQRRGFRSNRKNPAASEDGKILEAVSANQARMTEKGYRTVGEMLLKDPLFAEHKRNKGGEYITTVTRAMIEDEARAIFSAQRQNGSAFASERLEEAYLDILLSQRSFDDGPGGDSPYGGNQIERMIGRCALCPEEPRAARATYSFERFNLLERINHIRLTEDRETFPLSEEQRGKLIALAHKTEKLDYWKIRKELNLPETQRFNMVRYEKDKTPEECEKKTAFAFLKAYHTIRKAIDKQAKGRFETLSIDQRDAIGYAFTVYKTSDKIRAYLLSHGVEERDADALETLTGFSKTGHISVKACRSLMPFLEQGMNYSDACTAAGFAFKGHVFEEKTVLLHPVPEEFEDITSPVVRRSVSQTIKVVNAIIRKMGTSPTYINIELARDMTKDFQERNKLIREMDDNRAQNERIKEEIETTFHHPNPTGLDIVKLKLYKEQDGRCAYSLKSIDVSRLFEPNYVEIDHIVPYSISFDDTYKNKVLVLSGENRNKGNRLPLQYLTGKRRDDFIVWVNSSVRNYKKRDLLLKEFVSEENRNSFKDRNLQDTKHLSRFMMNYLNDHLLFADSPRGRKKRVTAVNGAVTSYMRKRWGLTKVREDGDLHHAVDALVVACTTDAMIQQISRNAVYRECQYAQDDSVSYAIDPKTGEVVREFPHPWVTFRKELEIRLSEDPTLYRELLLRMAPYANGLIPLPEHGIFVSRMPKRKVTGAAHKDTVKGAKELQNGFVVLKKPLTELKLENGEIKNYYDANSDRLLYEALKDRLVRFNGDAKKAFAEPFRKPKHDGTPGPVVNKVKLCEPSTLNVPVHKGKGVADNDSMVRIDVFHVEGDGYYFVPIYVADTVKPELPNKAVVQGKPYTEWKEMSDDNFIFSLYPNDLVFVSPKKPVSLSVVNKGSSLPSPVEKKNALMYYVKASISTGSITCITHDNSYQVNSMGIKTLSYFAKYEVDPLGCYHQVQKEARQSFHTKRG